MSWTIHGTPKPLVDYPWCKINDYDVEFANGLRQTRTVHEDVGGVGILPVTDEDKVILLDMPVFAVGFASSWFIPGGGIHKGKTLGESARAELLEETGLVTERLFPIVSFNRFPTFSRNVHHLFLATGLRKATAEELATIVPDPNELINQILQVPVDEAFEQIGKKITDAATIITLQWLKLQRSKSAN